MMALIQDILLSPIVVGLILVVAFVVISRWSLVLLREYAGYALGISMGLFFMLVYISLGGGTGGNPENTRIYLNIFEVFIATFFGLLFGAGIMVGLRFGIRFARGVALQVAFYTALNVILLFLAFIAGPITQRMIGIFALAIGIASLFGMVLFPTHTRQSQVSGMTSQSVPQPGDIYPPQPNQQGMSKLDEIRQKIGQRNQR